MSNQGFCLFGRVPFVLFMQHTAENQPNSLCGERFFIAWQGALDMVIKRRRGATPWSLLSGFCVQSRETGSFRGT
jgi:hypothetical protein